MMVINLWYVCAQRAYSILRYVDHNDDKMNINNIFKMIESFQLLLWETLAQF